MRMAGQEETVWLSATVFAALFESLDYFKLSEQCGGFRIMAAEFTV